MYVYKYNNRNTYGWKSEKRNGEDAEAWRYDLAHPCSRDGVAVADRRYSDDTPPEGVRVTREIAGVLAVRADGVLLRQIDEITAEYQAEETDVQRRY